MDPINPPIGRGCSAGVSVQFRALVGGAPKMIARVEALSTATRGARVTTLHAPLIREGVLELAGRRPLHHHGELTDVRIAWRMSGPEEAPVVCALGGISAHRRVCLSADPKAGWWSQVAPNRWTVIAGGSRASITWAAAASQRAPGRARPISRAFPPIIRRGRW